MRSTTAIRFAAFLVLCLGLGCAAEPLSDGLPDAIDCTTCHGREGNPAPPVSLDGATATTDLGVGAHQAHLKGGTIRSGVGCGACHVVPTSIEGHVDGRPAKVQFSELGSHGGLQPVWERGEARCSNVYCHGASLSGGEDTRPLWTQVDESQIACGSCHGNPPPAPHVSRSDCRACHPGTVKADGAIDLAGGQHIDGRVQLAELGCSFCHGSAENAAPPVSLSGSSDTADPAVGAHQEHLHDGDLRQAVACGECHVVPDSVDAPGHLDAGANLVQFGALAKTGSLTPLWDRTETRCSNVYCHGATLEGGSLKEPSWVVVDGTGDACGTCHGNPPPPPHPASAQCQKCHPATVQAGGTIDVAGGKHIDGHLDLNTNCSSCHGSTDNPAPPLSVSGESATSAIGVGAHQKHLKDSKLRKAIACDECHVVPSDPADPSHRDGLPAELHFGSLSTDEGELTPVFDRGTKTCSNTYCHGATLDGGQATEPVWTRVDGSQATCVSCHGLPPPPPHPAQTDCSLCHRLTVPSGFTIDVQGGRHINGDVDRNSLVR